MNERDLTGRVALVTGGSRGIGRACCELLAKSGADVAINYQHSEQAARESGELVAACGTKYHLCQADVSSPEEVEAMVAGIENSLGPIDLLVNNAGIFDYVSHEETTLDLWQRTLDVNLTGAYLVTWSVKPGMIQRQFGRVVNISSIAGLRPRPMSIAYSVSKAGLISFTKCAAEALAPHNVRVNAVSPGLIETEILAQVKQETLNQLVDSTPLGRIGQPEEIAELVLFLLSERSRFMTGQTLVASGGRVTLP